MKLNNGLGGGGGFALLLIVGLTSSLWAQSPLATNWRAYVPGPLAHSSPAVGADGVIYVGADGIEFGGPFRTPAELVAINPDGSQRWRRSTVDGFASPPAVGDDGTSYWSVGGTAWVQSVLYAVKSDGTNFWQYGTIPPNLAGVALGLDGTVYYSSSDGTLVALSPSGTNLWTFTAPDGAVGTVVNGRPAIGSDGTIYAGANNAGLCALSPAGQLLWSASAKEPADSFLWFALNSPVVAEDGTVYITSIEPGGLDPGRGHLFAFHPDGTRWWHFGAPMVFGDSPVIGADGSVYIGCADTNLYCLDRDGRLKWTFKAGGAIDGAGALTTGGTILFGASDGLVYAVRKDGTLLKTSQDTNGTSIALTLGADGTVYVASDGITLGALSPVAPPADAQWPTLGRDARHTGRTPALPLPAAPANLEASQGDPADKIRLIWESLPGALTYEVWRNTTNGLSTATRLVGFLVTTNSFEDLTAPASVTLYYWIRARNAGGLGPFAGPTTGFRPLPPSGGVVWQLSASGQAFNAPAEAADGTIYATSYTNRYGDPNFYISGTNGWLYAIDADGSVRWVRGFGDVVRCAPAIGADQTVYVGCFDYNLYALAPDNGVKWVFQARNAVTTTPAVGPDGTIYFGAPPVTYALRPDGSVKWTYTNAPPGSIFKFAAGPAVAANGQVFMVGSYTAVALDSGGSVLWSARTDGEVVGGLALSPDNSLLFASAGDRSRAYLRGHAWALAADGSTRWQGLEGTNYFSTPAIGPDGIVYLGSESNALYALNADGSTRWAFPTGAPVRASPAIASDGAVYFGATDGRFFAANGDGSARWQFDAGGAIGAAPLISAASNIVFGTDAGMLWCLRGNAPLAESGWPMFQHDPAHRGTQPTLPAAPVVPAEVVAGPAGGCGGMIRVTWRSSPGAERYELLRGTTNDLSLAGSVTTNLTVALQYDDDQADYGVSYHYWLRAFNAQGWSAHSQPVSARQTAKLWEFVTPAALDTSPVVADDGTILISWREVTTAPVWASTNYAAAISPDGRLLWRRPLPIVYTLGMAVGPDGNVYCLGGFAGSSVAVVNLQGTLVRQFMIGPRPVEVVAPLAVGWDGTLYYVTQYSIGAMSPVGDLLWQSSLPGSASSSSLPVVGPDGTITVDTGLWVASYHPDGRRRWSAPIASGSRLTVGEDGTAYVGFGYGTLRAFGLDGGQLWTAQGPASSSAVGSPCIAADGTIYWSGSGLRAFSPNGATNWSFSPPEAASEPPCLSADGLIYFLVERPGARIIALRSDGSEACEYPLAAVPVGPPVLCKNGLLLVALSNGKLQALQVPAGPQVGGWPMARHDSKGTSSLARRLVSPPAPEQVVATPFLDKLRVTWLDNGQWQTNEIWRAAKGETNSVLVGTVSPGTSRFDDTSAQPGMEYVYDVRARNQAGTGPFASSAAVGLPQDVSKLWSFAGPERLYGLTLGFDGTVYTYTYYGRLIAIAADGAKRWETNLNSQASGPVVVGADGTVYLSTFNGLHAFTPDGNPRWTAEPTLHFLTAPAISADGTLYVVDGIRSLAAYLPDGSLLWRKAFTGELHDAPVVAADATLRLATYDHQLFALNPDGTERWSALLSGVPSSGLALDSAGGALVATTDGPIQAIDADGHPRWSLLPALRSLTTAAIGSDGTIYESLLVTNSATGTGMCVLEALRSDGTELWTTPLEGTVFPPAIALAADGLLYLGSGTNLAAVDRGGQVRWMYDTGGPLPLAGPVLGLDGRLYIIGDKVLHALQTGSGPAANAWAMQRAHPRATASLNRPVPPPLHGGLESGRLRLTIPSPPPPAMALLGARDLGRWQILTSLFQGTNSVLLELPAGPDASEYYRIAFP